MKRIHKRVVAGATIEDKYFYSGRLGKKIPVGAKTKETSIKQLKQNERSAEEKLRHYINNNFGAGDWWICYRLPYGIRLTQEQIKKLLEKFLRDMRAAYRKAGQQFKYIYTAGLGKRGALHFHMICNRISAQTIATLWQKHAGNEKNKYPSIDFKIMDSRGNHAELASYIMKNSLEIFYDTSRRIHKKRWCQSTNLRPPKISYTVLKRNWNQTQKPLKGYYIQHVYDGIDQNNNPYRHIISVRI